MGGVTTVRELTFPLVIAHRGGANLFPENTMAAFEGAAALGCSAIEAGDLQLTSDGCLVAMHDTTVDRTTNGTGNVCDFTAEGIRGLRVDASDWFGGHWADQPVPTFDEILDRLGGSVVLVPESKGAGTATTTAIIEAVVTRGLQDSVIIQSFHLDDIALIAAAGIAPLYLMGSGTQSTPQEITAAGAQFIGLNQHAPDFGAAVGALKDAGLRVLAWTVDMQRDFDVVLSAGCDGVFTNEPLYAPRNYAYRTTTAPWPADGTYSSGMLVYPGVGPLLAYPEMQGGRGPLIGEPGAWRWALDETPSLAGPVCPIAANFHTVTVDLVYDSFPTSDSTCWAGIYVGVETDDCPDDTDPSTGYLVALAWNGSLTVSKRTAEGMAGLGTTPTSPITAAGQRVTIAVTTTPTGFTVTRVDDGVSASYLDTAWSGGYLFLRNAGDGVAAVSCATLSVT
jgi:glycerophosphoryl diester phosphodiesterase